MLVESYQGSHPEEDDALTAKDDDGCVPIESYSFGRCSWISEECKDRSFTHACSSLLLATKGKFC